MELVVVKLKVANDFTTAINERYLLICDYSKLQYYYLFTSDCCFEQVYYLLKYHYFVFSYPGYQVEL
jgi:hypothetical protein